MLNEFLFFIEKKEINGSLKKKNEVDKSKKASKLAER